MIKTALGKILTAKAAAVVAALAAGGVAVAAGTGNLPAQHRHQVSAQSEHSPESSHPEHPSPSSTPSGSPSAGDHHTATPSPSLVGLCRAYTAHVGVAPGKALENPAFTALITAAGGKDKVTGFCTTLLAGKDAAHSGGSDTKPSAHPTHPTHPAHPSGPPSPTPTPTPHAP